MHDCSTGQQTSSQQSLSQEQQIAPQRRSSSVQGRHCPLSHSSFSAQALSQAPQWKRLALVSTHSWPQRVRPDGQVQAPLTQVDPVGQH
jgi:hypothetical protein